MSTQATTLPFVISTGARSAEWRDLQCAFPIPECRGKPPPSPCQPAQPAPTTDPPQCNPPEQAPPGPEYPQHQRIAGPQLHMRQGKQSTGAPIHMRINHRRRQHRIRRPMRQRFTIQQQLILRRSRAQIKVAHANRIFPRRPARLHRKRATRGAIASNSFPPEAVSHGVTGTVTYPSACIASASMRSG